MAADPTPAGSTLPTSVEQMFPTLTPAQIERVAAHGRRRAVQRGEILFEAGQQHPPFFVVTAGKVDILRPSRNGEDLVVIHQPGQFSGEVQMLSGRRTLVRARVREPGEVLELDHAGMLALVQVDGELSEILMRAFILRRIELVAHGFGDVVLVGSQHSAGTLRIKEFLSRNSHPYAYMDLDHDPDVQELLDHFKFTATDVPVLICRGELVLRDPSNREVAECLGFNEDIDSGQLRDLIVIGAGPSGLAAAVYGASEGLDVLVIETDSPGGQAGSSSRIENYLGFPTGITGQELGARAYAQAQKFGAQLSIARGARKLLCGQRPYRIETDDGKSYAARCVLIASGAAYRKPPLPNLAQFEGAGIYYAATFMEAQLCAGEEVIVVGGGNSAGQAAVFLADNARHVHMLVRAEGLAASMSRYLIRRIEEHPRITLHVRTEIAALEGAAHLEKVRWLDHAGGQKQEHPIRHVFIMAGADPATGWLEGCLTLDPHGFIKTGTDLSPEDLAAARWPRPRPPQAFETSLPGVFAVGDVRSGSIKRVASAVGEGSVAISFVHKTLQE